MQRKKIIFLSQEGCLEGSMTPNTIILAKKYGEVGRLPRTKHGQGKCRRHPSPMKKPSYPMSDRVSRIRQNAPIWK